MEKVFSVSEYIEYLNASFGEYGVRIVGEISELKIHSASGHVYFTIKDKIEEAVLDAILWRRTYRMYGIPLEPGMEVILTGAGNIYPKSGRFSFIASSVELVGEGALKKAYDALKAVLEREGLFAPGRKRALPEFIHRIGVISSKEGAAIGDFTANLGRYGFEILFMDSRVEGQSALIDLLAAARTMRKQAIDVLVVIRGGGSLESLQAFNNEQFVREVADFPVPVIMGIGHERDVPLAALAADVMVSTPTAAAHRISGSWDEAFERIRAFMSIIDTVETNIERVRDRISMSWNEIAGAFQGAVENTQRRLDSAGRTALLNDPMRQLRLGFSITRRGNRIVKNAGDLKLGDILETQFEAGQIRSRVQ